MLIWSNFAKFSNVVPYALRYALHVIRAFQNKTFYSILFNGCLIRMNWGIRNSVLEVIDGRHRALGMKFEICIIILLPNCTFSISAYMY